MLHLTRLFLIFALSAQLTPTIAAEEEKPEYKIRENEPRTGTSIRRDILSASQIPINKRYHELSPEVKAELNKYYERMEPGDEPPFPAEGMRSIFDAIAKAQSKLLVRGELILLVKVNSNGDATEVKAIGSPSPEMTNFVASVLLLTKFKPAICGGRTCTMEYPFRFQFSVKL